ncbi:MAG: FxDxF family PEP-CTERM protein [Azoarcus sp.]|nr:FxDxF family PEP-CTERM protein [Azoarcus sp.]
MMMKLKQTVAAVALGLACIAAHAENINFGSSLTLDNSIHHVSYDFMYFEDYYTFSVDSALVGSSNWLDVMLTVSNDHSYNYSGIEFQLFKGTQTDDPSQLIASFSYERGVTPEIWQQALALESSQYAIKITGTGTGYGNGSGTYFLDLGVSAVPEPETYAMMLAGLGIVGMVARRRKMTVN